MIQIFTIGQPKNELKTLGEEIALLPQGAFNLSATNTTHQILFDKLYALGVRQIIHDGKADVIECLDGHLYAQKAAFGQTVDPKDILRITLG